MLELDDWDLAGFLEMRGKKRWGNVLTLQAIAGQLSPSEYRGAAVPGGVGAPSAGRGRV